jgi:hypothetical protein
MSFDPTYANGPQPGLPPGQSPGTGAKASATQNGAAATASAAANAQVAAPLAQQTGTSAAPPLGSQKKKGHDPMWVLDANKAIVVTPGVTEHEFSQWTMDLRAQVSGATVSTYTWTLTNAPDATSVTGSNTYRLQFTWANFSSGPKSDTITVKETPTVGSAITQILSFSVAGTSSPAWVATPPTSSTTWPNVITPDAVTPDQETAGSGMIDPAGCG